MKLRLDEDIIALFVAQNVVPYTNAGINLIVATIKARLDQGVTFGHFSPDVETVVTAPDVSGVSNTDKQAREITLTAEATFAGAIQKLFLTLNIQF